MWLICLIVSIISGILYLNFLTNIPIVLKTFEHKYIGFLSVLLVFFNNPFYGFTLIYQNTVFIFIGNFLIVIYLSSIVVFWVIMFERIHRETIMISSKLFNKKNKILFVAIFILMLVYFLFLSYFTKYYPGVHVDAEYPRVFRVF